MLGKGNGTFTTGTTLSNVPSFVADFNGDGIADVLATSSGYLLVFLGNGDGTFQTPKATYTGIQLSGLAVADLVTGNNDASVLVPNPDPSGGVLVYLGKGDGTFAAPVNYPSPYAYQLFVGDFNGDGKPDILGPAGGVFVLLGNGDGTFQTARITNAPALAFLAAIGDVNDDQKLDLVIYTDSSTTQFAVMFGNGDGTFQQPSNLFTPTVSSSPALADVNGDGKLDLLVEGFPFLQVYLGNGDGTFTAGSAYSFNFQNLNPSSSILVGDFNHDGKPDITASQSILFGNGDGTFQASPAILSPNGDPIIGAASGDFNGDGRSDLAITSYGNLYIYLADATGTFSLAHTYAISAAGSPEIGDFNGDGKLDLITVVNPSGTPLLAVLLGNGDGSFGAPVESGICTASLSGGATADLNGDHKSDVAGPDGESLSICLGNGDGTFALPLNYFYGTGAQSVVVADFNNDGKPDAVVGGEAGFALFLGNGDGTFQAPNYFVTAAQRYLLTNADLNRDGNQDLIVNETVYLGNGKGEFQPLGQPTLGLGGTIVDLNGDGYLDLVSSDYSASGNVQILAFLGNGNGSFQPSIVIESVGGGILSGLVQTGDFNGDGRSDLAIPWPAENNNISYLRGVQILLNTTPPAPGVTISPSAPTFPIQPVGTSSSPLSVTVNNTGKGVLTVSGVKFTGKNASDFSQTNNCTTIQPGANCTIKVVFTPTVGGNAAASLAITDDAVGSPQTVAVSGTATAPSVTVSPSALTFPAQAIGTSSSPVSVTVNNTSSKAVLTVSAVTITGADASEFKQTNNCTTVQPGANCTIKVIFTPAAAGNPTASLGITDNAEGSPQAVALSGTGTAASDFAIGPGSGSSDSATIPVGQSASFNLTITPAGSFSGTVSLSCAITPTVTPAPNCTVPASVNVTQGTAAAVTAKVSTTAAGTSGSTSTATFPPGMPPITWTIVLLASGLLLVGSRRRIPALAIPMIAIVFFGMAACGGGGSSNQTATPGTPAGTYTATVTARSGSLSHTTALTVIVQ